MEDFRSKSFGDGRMQMESYNYNGYKRTPSGLQDFRCHSASYASSSNAQQPQTQMEMVKDVKFKKGKSKSINGSSKSWSWSFNDPELQRKKRVASYKVYTAEANVKGSLKRTFRWLKNRYDQMIYGWR